MDYKACDIKSGLNYNQKQPPELFCKTNVFLEISQNLLENICKSLAQVFSCKLCEISENTFYREHLQTV